MYPKIKKTKNFLIFKFLLENISNQLKIMLFE